MVSNNAFSGAFSEVPEGSVDLNLTKVIAIGDNAFNGAIGVKTLNLTNNTSLQSIGASAFADTSVKSINLSNATKLTTTISTSGLEYTSINRTKFSHFKNVDECGFNFKKIKNTSYVLN